MIADRLGWRIHGEWTEQRSYYGSHCHRCQKHVRGTNRYWERRIPGGFESICDDCFNRDELSNQPEIEGLA